MGNASTKDSNTLIAAEVVDEQQTPDGTVPVTIATPIEINQTGDGMPSNREGTTGVSLTMSTEYSVYSSSSAVDTLIGVNLEAAPAPSDSDRAPVDCVVVSDVSGSMAGSKMTLLKSTVNLLLDEFVAKDKVGLVTFDTNVKERLPLQSMTGEARTNASAVVNSFRSGSSTNLSGGCFAGIQQLLNSNKNEKDGHIRTVFLMTDGQANNGLITANDIIPVITNMLEGSGISLHTFGYGSDHDSDLLRKISNAGNGSYYFVEGVDDIRSAFGDCLGGMLSVVAQNLEVELEAINGATITKVHHKNAVVLEANKRYRVPFADLYGDEQRDVLVAMHLPVSSSGDIKDEADASGQVLRATLRYIDVLAAKPATETMSIGACRSSGAQGGAVQNEKLALQATRLRVAETLESAKASAERGDLASARATVEATRAEIRTKSALYKNSKQAQEMLPVFEGDLHECADGLVDRDAYRNVSHKMSNWAEGHAQQRCMESTVSAGAVGCAAPSLRNNAYRTKAKSSKASKFYSS